MEFFSLINDSKDQIVFVTKQNRTTFVGEFDFLVHRYDKQEHYTITQKIDGIAVFESNGALLWHQRQHAHWLVNDQIPFYLSNDGTIYIAEFGSYNNPMVHQTDSLHISVYNSDGIWNYAEGFGNDPVFNCGKTVLKDGRFVVCGVPCPNQRNPEKLITYFVSSDGEVDKEESSIEHPHISMRNRYTGKTFQDSQPQCSWNFRT